MTDYKLAPVGSLKPCPFCGGNNITKAVMGATERFLGRGEGDTSFWFARIQCLDCGTKQGRMEDYPLLGPPSDDDYEPAITAWNNRKAAAQEPVSDPAVPVVGEPVAWTEDMERERRESDYERGFRDGRESNPKLTVAVKALEEARRRHLADGNHVGARLVNEALAQIKGGA